MPSSLYKLATAAATAAFVSAQVTGELGDAEVIRNNPIGATWVATLPDREDTTLRGTVRASSADDGVGVNFDLDITGLPVESSGGEPFTYHLHVDPVPADGNCTSTLAHLDQTIRGEDPPCDPSAKETCQTGDLSGKHGKMDGPDYQTEYLDKYAALVPDIGAFFGNRSIVFHYANKTRISCANFSLVDSGEADYSSTYLSSSATDINVDGADTFTDTKTISVTSACPSDPAYCYNNGTSATTSLAIDNTVLLSSADATASPTGDANDDVDDANDDDVDEVDDVDDIDDIDDVDDNDSLATETTTGAPVLSTDGAATGVWISGGAVFAALAAFVL